MEQRTKLFPMPMGVDLDEKEWAVMMGPNGIDLFVAPISEAQDQVLNLLSYKHILLLGENAVRDYENGKGIDTDYCAGIRIDENVITNILDQCRGYSDFREITKEELIKNYKR